MTDVIKKIIIRGQVHGVGYRFFAYKHAKNLGINGYAKNLFSGEVEIIAFGEIGNVDLFTILLKEGPKNANVTEVEVLDTNDITKYTEFGMD